MQKRHFLFLFALIVALLTNNADAKSYKFEFKHSYNVFIVQTGRNGVKVVQAWATAKNSDKAIDQCKQDAVAAAIFTGIPVAEGTMGTSKVPPLAKSQQTYTEHKEWFDTFFKKGQFMEFVSEINSTYPSGENNLQVPGGRKVTIFLGIRYDELRKFLVDSGIIPKLQDYFTN